MNSTTDQDAREIAHPTIDDRKARGLTARDNAALSSHARWHPAADRPDPVALLEKQDATREPDLVPIRHGRMLVSPFTFYRGAALRQLRERVQHALAALPAQENFVLRSHYVQEIPFETIAGMLHLTKGRVSQIHKQGLLRLRGLVGERADWTASF